MYRLSERYISNSLALLFVSLEEDGSEHDVFLGCPKWDRPKDSCRLSFSKVCWKVDAFTVASSFNSLEAGLDCHSRTAILKAETSSIHASLLSHVVSSCTCLMSYRPCGEGGTLIAEVFVSKEDLVCGVGAGKGANGLESTSKAWESVRFFSSREFPNTFSS